MRLPLFALTIALAACTERARAPSEATLDSLAGPTPTAPLVDPPAPNEVLRLDTAFVGTVTVERGETVYSVDRTAGQVMAEGQVAALDRAAFRAWLARFTPLTADGRYDALAPQAVQDGADAMLVFAFADGSGRTVSLLRQGDGVAAVSQDDGPVWRLPDDALDTLVPPAAALTR